MARPTPSPPAVTAQEVVTPLQKLLVGTFLIALALWPLVAFAFYLSPLYKAPGASYRGDYFMIGLGVALAIAFAGTFVWMSYLPGLLERRAEKRVAREAEARAKRREDERKAREERTDAAASRTKDEEE